MRYEKEESLTPEEHAAVLFYEEIKNLDVSPYHIVVSSPNMDLGPITILGIDRLDGCYFTLKDAKDIITKIRAVGLKFGAHFSPWQNGVDTQNNNQAKNFSTFVTFQPSQLN